MPNIRLVTENDAEAIAAIYAPFCTSSFVSFEEVAPSGEEMRTRIAKVLPRYPWLVFDDEGTVAGYAYGHTHRERAAYRWSVEAAIYIHPDYGRKGIGRALYTVLFSILAAQGYFRVFAGVTLPNPGSERLHESVGFTKIGVYERIGWKMGGWRDVGWYQRSLAEGKPGTILTVDEMMRSAAWEKAIREGLSFYRG